jgi:hypothetical protein
LLRYWGKQRAYWGKCPSSYIVKKCPVHQLQIVYNCQEKSQKQRNITGDEKDIFFEKYVELLAGSRLFCGAIHSSVRLHRAKNNIERGNIYFE